MKVETNIMTDARAISGQDSDSHHMSKLPQLHDRGGGIHYSSTDVDKKEALAQQGRSVQSRGDFLSGSQSHRSWLHTAHDIGDSADFHGGSSITPRRSDGADCDKCRNRRCYQPPSRFQLLESRFLLPLVQPRQVTLTSVQPQPDIVEATVTATEAEQTVAQPETWSPVTFYDKALAQDTNNAIPLSIKPLVKFRRVVKMIVLLLRATYSSRDRSQSRYNSLFANFLGSNWTASKSAYEMYGISFNPRDFKANREIPVSAEAKAILSLEPSRRSPHQLRQTLVSLRQAVKEFSEFPITMQESLVRVGWYEHFEAKRVIIRQGHTADNFYFILSGTAAVVVLERDKHTGEQVPRTAAFLGKGKSFGELALMHKSRRSATVTCKDDVELLAVGREDFIDIFMHVERGVEPEHVTFLRSVPILRDWPIEVLPLDNPKILLFTYVRRGVLLCKDSNTSSWIYVVKSGHCRVIKALRAVQAGKAYTSRESPLLSTEFPLLASLSPYPRLPGIGQTKKYGAEVKVASVSNECDQSDVTWILNRDPHRDEKERLEHLHTLDAILEQRNLLLNLMAHNDSKLDLESSFKSPAQSNRNEKNVVFVDVVKLVHQDIYGLESCVFKSMNKTTSTSLVSDGAEVIMIDRKFFLDNTSEELRKKLRKEIRPLPSEETLQSQLDAMVNWEVYRHQTLKETVSSRKRRSQSDLRG